MSSQTFLWCLWPAIFFAVYQLMLRPSGLPPAAAGFIMHLVGTIIFIPVCVKQKVDWKLITLFAGSLGVAAGVSQAFGHVWWQKVLADKNVDLGTAAIVMIMMNIVVVVIGSAVFFGEKITLNKGAGFALGAFAIWLMVRK